MITGAWSDVKRKIIANYFPKASFVAVAEEACVDALDDNDDFKYALDDELRKVAEFPEAVPTDLTAQDFVSADDNVHVVAEMTDTDIMADVAGARESTGMLHIKDQPRGACNQEPLACTSSNAQLKISTTTAELRFNNTTLVTMTGQPTERLPDENKPCAVTCKSKASLKRHMFAQCHSEPEKCPTAPPSDVQMGEGFGCSSSPSAFSRSESDENHMSKCTDEEPCKRDLSPVRFSECTSLQQYRQAHMGEKPHKCDLCPAEFRQGVLLRRHRRTHTGERPYECDVCPKKFGQIGHLHVHKQTHMGGKPFKCDLCPAEYTQTVAYLELPAPMIRHCTQSTSLSRHKRGHRDRKPHKCDLCPAAFSRSTSLHQHKRAHTGKKPHKCDLCPAAFSRSTSLHQHKRAHTGKKPHKCDLCPAEFSESTYLQQHKRTHTGERPFKCDLCPAEFGHNSSMSRHRRAHTGEKPHKCDLRPAEFS
ncbi:zinc finger protein 235-like [Ornithodoros turicata]|uniref:zinc finger protein 235-like n=1 Tax=Ornithodoros turicata TaxID=34597 RepID=UPI0031392DC1